MSYRERWRASRSGLWFGFAGCIVLPTLLACGVPRLHAQNAVPNVAGADAVPVPHAGHSYIRLLNATVNPADGSLSVRVVIPAPKGRGPSIPAGFVYNTNGTHTLTAGTQGGTGEWNVSSGYLTQGGWSYLLPRMTATTFEEVGSPTDPVDPGWQCDIATDFVYADPAGGLHALGLAEGYDWGTGACTRYASPQAYSYSTGGDGGIQAVCSGAGGEGCLEGGIRVTDADGTAYEFPSPFAGGVNEFNPDTSVATGVMDRNGNEETIAASANGAFTVTDSLGRAAIVSSGFGSSGQTLTVAGEGTFTVDWGTATVNFTATVQDVFPSTPSCAV